MTPLMITLLAEEPANTGPDFGKASPMGLLVVVLLLIGVFALVWSMNRHLRRVPGSFDTTDAGGTPDRDTSTAETGERADESGG